MPVRVAINGFGRLGRSFLRAAHEHNADLEVVAVNDLVAPSALGQLLKYDSVYGRFPGSVVAEDGGISIDHVYVRALDGWVRSRPLARSQRVRASPGPARCRRRCSDASA
jgi:glyceraldehyde-3-phosphate dehydrogenase/erythrose-4-phosphate dehydrogenase